jgi:hypothetical protein
MMPPVSADVNNHPAATSTAARSNKTTGFYQPVNRAACQRMWSSMNVDTK